MTFQILANSTISFFFFAICVQPSVQEDSNECRVLSPYAGQGLGQNEDTYNPYLSSCRTIVEQAFGMLTSRC